jgi:hypothetical protein
MTIAEQNTMRTTLATTASWFIVALGRLAVRLVLLLLLNLRRADFAVVQFVLLGLLSLKSHTHTHTHTHTHKEKE